MKRKYTIWLLVLCIFAGSSALSSCGSMRSYWGIDGNYDFDEGYHYGKHKPPKHKKYKKPKPPKHKKHHHHHDDDDDDDDDD